MPVEGSGLGSGVTQDVVRDWRLGNLTTPESVQELRSALHAKAKGSPSFRFYALYDKVYRADVLGHAYERCRAKAGAAGVDGERFEDIQGYGVERWLSELTQELKKKRYRAEAIKRVYIPKADGKMRPLGIPTIRDRVVQTAMVLVLEPIFEADLQSEQYAYRVDHTALEAVEQVRKLLKSGHREVVDADLSEYFETIPHAELMQSIARRVSDGTVLHLIKMWLEAAVEEEDERGGKKRTTVNRQQQRGIPQGAPISPLLSNLYMRRFVLGWRKLGYAKRFGAQIVNYADDLVICCQGEAQQALQGLRRLMERLKLTVNEKKTRVCQTPQESFDFLGYTYERCYWPRTGRAYQSVRPSKKSLRRMLGAIRAETDRRSTRRRAEEVVERLNRKLQGWANYFRLGTVNKAYRTIDTYTAYRLRRWLCEKHKVRAAGHTRFPRDYLYNRLKLHRLVPQPRGSSCAKA